MFGLKVRAMHSVYNWYVDLHDTRGVMFSIQFSERLTMYVCLQL